MSNMAQQYALTELALENKLVDERQKNAVLESRISSKAQDLAKIDAQKTELEKQLDCEFAKNTELRSEMERKMAENDKIIESEVQVELLQCSYFSLFLGTLETLGELKSRSRLTKNRSRDEKRSTGKVTGETEHIPHCCRKD